jgi:hypothetical protein
MRLFMCRVNNTTSPTYRITAIHAYTSRESTTDVESCGNSGTLLIFLNTPMINQQLYKQVSAIVLQKIQEQIPQAQFKELPPYGLTTVITPTVNWQGSVAQEFLAIVYDQLQRFTYIREDGTPYCIDDYYQHVDTELFERDSNELLNTLTNCDNIFMFLMTRCMKIWHGVPKDDYPHLIHK